MPKIEKIKRRHLLKARDQKDEIGRLERELGCHVRIPQDARLEEGILDDGSRVILYDGTILFFEDNERMTPSLRALLNGMIEIPEVTVDMGAVRFVVNGADIMAPGITRVDDRIHEGSIVAIVDETHGKHLAIGISTLSSEGLRRTKSGKVIHSIHHIGDEIWEFGKE